MNQALGLLETKGLVGAIEAADAMAKAADITIVSKEKSTAALVTIKIVGDTSAVRAALDAGAAAAESIGQLISVHLIPSPDEQIEYLIKNSQKIAVKPADNSISDETTVSEKNVDEVPQTKIALVEEEAIEEVFVKEPIEEIPDETEDPVVSEVVEEAPEDEPEETSEVSETIDFTPENKNLFENFTEKETEPEKDISSEPLKSIPIEEKTEEQEVENLFGMEEQGDDSFIDGSKIPSMEELENLSVPELRKLARSVENFPIKGREISKANKQILLSYFKMM